MRSALAAVLVLVACAGTLPPRGQILLYVDTDAPVPAPYGSPLLPGAPAPLFDTLVIDVTTPSGPCDHCSRTVGLDSDALVHHRISFGIPSKPGVVGYQTRLRMYDSRATLTGTIPDDIAGQPPPSVVDVTFSLPPIGDEGIVERTAVLHVEDVGKPTTEDTIAGAPKSSLVGTWEGAKRTPCATDPLAGEVCIPGGSFWMGNPRVRDVRSHGGSDIRRLVKLSPYFIDRSEVTVAQFRASKIVMGVVPWSMQSTGNADEDYCTFTTDPGPHESLPINCLSPAAARQFCTQRGADLPTEAQFEYVASAFVSALYVWGDDDTATCTDAVFGRAGYGVFKGLVAPCKPATPPGGPLPVATLASPRRDRVNVGDDAVFDLIGNVEEFSRDTWNRETEPCWSIGGVYVDPLCTQSSSIDKGFVTFRGGGWNGGLADGAAARHEATPTIGGLFVPGGFTSIGFRCARATN